MQFLVFHLGDDRYGLHTRTVVRVLPLMELKHIPQAPQYVAGLMNLHGEPVPVIDLCMLACGTACTRQYDTRIVLVDYRAGSGRQRKLGLAVERVTGIERHEAAEFSESGILNADAPYLGQVGAAGRALLQLVNVDYLLTDQVRSLLFPDPAAANP